MWLVAGLGNPGAKYARNRHNIGFMVVDELVSKHGLAAFSVPSYFGQCEVTSGLIVTERGREKIAVVKPMGFMNLSGFAVARVAGFHKIELDHILVVHDELDLDFGIVRLKSGGGHGGHNGLRSIQEQLGDGGYARLRMGIGRDPNSKPGAKDAAGWVLSDFPKAHEASLSSVIKAGCEDIETVVAKGIKDAMNQHNARPNVSSPGTGA
jgi:PTH1 family peptidyl-tRNA hydrolase